MQRFIPLLATLVVVAVNAAANIVPINGVNTGELSARYPTGFTPAGWVFGIWSLIYVGLIAASLACMLVILVSLLTVYVRLNERPPATLAERACVDWPFSLYLGWITTATLANLAALFFDLGTYPFGLAMDEWAIMTVVGATGVYAAAGVRTRDAIYTAVFVWAALGIVLQTLPISEPVRLAAAAGCAVAVVVSAVSLLQGGRRYGAG